MEKICHNCEYWNEDEDLTGECELQPISHDYNPAIDILEGKAYKITEADDTCEDFELKYNVAD